MVTQQHAVGRGAGRECPLGRYLFLKLKTDVHAVSKTEAGSAQEHQTWIEQVAADGKSGIVANHAVQGIVQPSAGDDDLRVPENIGVLALSVAYVVQHLQIGRYDGQIERFPSGDLCLDERRDQVDRCCSAPEQKRI